MELFAPEIYIPYSAHYIYHQRSIKTASIITKYRVQNAIWMRFYPAVTDWLDYISSLRNIYPGVIFYLSSNKSNIIHHYSTPRTPYRIHTRHRILRCDRMQNCDIPTCRPQHTVTQLTATNQRIDQLLILAFLLDNQCDKCAVWTRFPPRRVSVLLWNTVHMYSTQWTFSPSVCVLTILSACRQSLGMKLHRGKRTDTDTKHSYSIDRRDKP